MISYDVGYANISILQDDIAEIVVKEGVEVTVEIVDDLHCFLISNLKVPFSVMVNKKNQYMFDFDAQLKMGDIPQFHAVAVVSYSKIAETVAKGMVNYPRATTRECQFFSNRKEALQWLISIQSKL